MSDVCGSFRCIYWDICSISPCTEYCDNSLCVLHDCQCCMDIYCNTFIETIDNDNEDCG